MANWELLSSSSRQERCVAPPLHDQHVGDIAMEISNKTPKITPVL
jgi:hypothetical protein